MSWYNPIQINLTAPGISTGPFDLYSDYDSYTTPYETGITKSIIVSGYNSYVPDNTFTIRVKSNNDNCTNYIDLLIGGLPVTTTTTTIPGIPMYNLKTTYGTDETIVDITECNINRWTITTTGVTNGTIFNIICMSNNFLSHYRFRDSSGVLHTGVNNLDLSILNGSAYCDVECIVDRIVEPTDGLDFTCYVPEYSPYHPANSPAWMRSYLLSDVTPSYLFYICGTWGENVNSSDISCQIVSTSCDKLKQIDTLTLYRKFDVADVTMTIKQWNYSEVDNGGDLNVLHFIEQGNYVAVDAIRDGYRYTYKLVAVDIFGNTHVSNEYQVACRVYVNMKITNYSVYHTLLPGSWNADMTLQISTNIQYSKSGFISASKVGGNPNNYSNNTFSVSSPVYASVTNTDTCSLLTLFSFAELNNAEIVFGTGGELFTSHCGEQISINIPVGYTEPIINYI